MIGQRIRQARRMRGMTLEQLAAKAGVTPQAISKYEKGKAQPRSDTMVRLAGSLDVTVEYLLREASSPNVKALYRKQHRTAKAHDEMLLEQVRDWLDRYGQVEHLLGLEQPGTPISRNSSARESTLDEAEHAAAVLRRQWNLGEDPISNLVALCEDKGIRIGELETDSGFEACTFIMDNAGGTPVIVLRKGVYGDRQRFSIAHELGHLALRPAEDLDEERAAHRFAGAFLVPAAAARRELGEHRDRLPLAELHALKHEYGISMQAWICRARDLGIISASKAKSMFIEFKARGWSRVEPGSQIESESPRRFDILVIRALDQGLISASRAREILNEPLHGFLSRMSTKTGGVPIEVRR